MNLLQKMQKIAEIEAVETPWFFSRIFGKVQLFGSQISFYSGGNTDFVDIYEAQQAIEWLVEQLGGQVKWQKNSQENNKITGKKK